MKKYISAFLALVMLLGLFATATMFVSAEEVEDDGVVTFVVPVDERNWHVRISGESWCSESNTIVYSDTNVYFDLPVMPSFSGMSWAEIWDLFDGTWCEETETIIGGLYNTHDKVVYIDGILSTWNQGQRYYTIPDTSLLNFDEIIHGEIRFYYDDVLTHRIISEEADIPFMSDTTILYWWTTDESHPYLEEHGYEITITSVGFIEGICSIFIDGERLEWPNVRGEWMGDWLGWAGLSTAWSIPPQLTNTLTPGDTHVFRVKFGNFLGNDCTLCSSPCFDELPPNERPPLNLGGSNAGNPSCICDIIWEDGFEVATSAYAEFTWTVPGASSENDTPDPPVNDTPYDYYVTQNFGTWDGTGEARATIRGNYQAFTSLTFGTRTLVRGIDFVVTAGSTQITFTPAFLATLQSGTHNFVAHFGTQTVDLSLTIPATTGDNQGGSNQGNNQGGNEQNQGSGNQNNNANQGKSPNTGQTIAISVAIVAMLSAMGVVGFMIHKKKATMGG